jgi:toxin ParE1/3/4
MPDYVLTRRAEADLIEIAQYTRREWGKRQRDKYIRELFDLFASIAETPHLSLNRDEIRPDLKSRRHKKTHVVFYKMEGKIVQILRVLHVAQDVGFAFLDE